MKTGIYRITNTVNNKFYIGSSKDIKNRWRKHRYDLKHNCHPNQHLQNAWNKYGESVFAFDVIEVCELKKEVILEREQYYIDTLNPQYNIVPLAGTNLGLKHSEETKIKISINNKAKTEEVRKKMSDAHKGKKHSEETKKRMSDVKKGKLSEETLLKMSVARQGKSSGMLGKVVSDDTKNKISEKLKGKVLSEETKEKMRLSHLGKKMSDEAKRKMSEAKKGKKKT